MAKRKKLEEKKSWIVTLKVERKVEIVTSECTRDDAWNNPYEFCEEEVELDQYDWEVLDIEENE